MKQRELANLTNEELLKKATKNNSNAKVNALLIGVCVGVAIYSVVQNGFSFFTFFPLIIAYLAFGNRKKNKALEAELKSRGLK